MGSGKHRTMMVQNIMHFIFQDSGDRTTLIWRAGGISTLDYCRIINYSILILRQHVCILWCIVVTQISFIIIHLLSTLHWGFIESSFYPYFNRVGLFMSDFDYLVDSGSRCWCRALYWKWLIWLLYLGIR